MTFDQYERFKAIRQKLEHRGHQAVQARVTPGIERREHDPATDVWLTEAQQYLDGKRQSLPHS